MPPARPGGLRFLSCPPSPVRGKMREKGGDFMSSFNLQIPDFSQITATPYNPASYSFSDTQFEIIRKYVKDFQNSLDSDQDVALLLTNFGQSVLMEVTEIGYEESVLMVFRGYVNGRMSTLIQHISQLNFLLTSVPKAKEQPKRQIGFTAKWAEQ